MTINYFLRQLYYPFLILLLLFFIYPISISSSLGGISSNYSFVLLTIFLIFYNFKIYKPPNEIIIYIFIFTFIYIFNLYEFIDNDLYLRKNLSFIIFMLIFSFSFVKIPPFLEKLFLISFALFGILLSIYSIYSFLSLGGNDLQHAAKALMGTSRYGFIFLISSFIIFSFEIKRKYLEFFLKIILIIICIIGLFLTYSRAAVITLMLVSFLYMYVSIYNYNKKNSFKNTLKYLSYMLFLFFLILSIIYIFLYSSFAYYFDRIILIFFNLGTATFDISNPLTSEGYRLRILFIILNVIKENFCCGTGYLGIWSLNEYEFYQNGTTHIIGSAHSQFFDLLLRTGILGFFTFLFMIFRLLKFFYTYKEVYFWCIISMLIYGLFHETFKLSYGCFFLSFIIGIYSNNINKKNEPSH